jgi:RNA polymerase sigma-70 factor (ECF subfamily)
MDSEAAAAELEQTRLVRAGTADILEALYIAQREAVFRYLRAISRDEDTALDLAATTFERAFAEVRAGRDPGIGWLLRTARNAAIDADRRSRTAALFRWRSSGAEGSSPSPEEQTLGAEQATRVRAALALLPQPQRDVIALRYTSDLTIREIAVVIGKRASATQKLLDRGLARLKESLDDLD